MPRITIICPEAVRADANQLGAALGFGMADAQTYGPAVWVDSLGRKYSCASLDVSDSWFTSAQKALARPAWDEGKQVSMAAAARAQGLLSVWIPDGGPIPQATPGRILVVVGVDGVSAVLGAGLSEPLG